ncbi:MAG: hypothetical protein ACLQQ4_06755 [Bacteroidia bacterium]
MRTKTILIKTVILFVVFSISSNAQSNGHNIQTDTTKPKPKYFRPSEDPNKTLPKYLPIKGDTNKKVPDNHNPKVPIN